MKQVNKLLKHKINTLNTKVNSLEEKTLPENLEKKIGDVKNKNKIPVSGLPTTAVLNTKIGEVKDKILDISGLATTAILNTKIGEDNNKIPLSGWVKETNYDTKISSIEAKDFNTSNYKKFTSKTFFDDDDFQNMFAY